MVHSPVSSLKSPGLGVSCDSGSGIAIGFPMLQAERSDSPTATAIRKIAAVHFMTGKLLSVVL
jgi:hypothetical protein